MFNFIPIRFPYYVPFYIYTFHLNMLFYFNTPHRTVKCVYEVYKWSIFSVVNTTWTDVILRELYSLVNVSHIGCFDQGITLCFRWAFVYGCVWSVHNERELKRLTCKLFLFFNCVSILWWKTHRCKGLFMLSSLLIHDFYDLHLYEKVF